MEAAISPEEARAIWESKPVLRTVYRDYYRSLAGWCRPGRTVEVGAGGGDLKGSLPGTVTSDIVWSPGLDLVLDAQALPFRDGSLANIVGVDVLHHVEYARRFLAEAQRVLEPGGRIALMEPAITPLSWVAYKLGHPEPIDLSADPLADGTPDPSKHPFDANQAVPTLLASRHRRRLYSEFPALQIVCDDRLSLIAYPLSGGFRPWCLLPERLVPALLRLEQRLSPSLAPLLGFRLLLVFEKEDPMGSERVAEP